MCSVIIVYIYYGSIYKYIHMSAFAFGHRELERRYQDFYLSSCIDRIRPIIYFLYAPIVGTIRFSILLHSELYGPRLGRPELILLGTRLFILVIVLVLLSRKWAGQSNLRRGLFVFWLKRAALILAAQQMMGDSGDPQIMSTLVSSVFLGGLITPSFVEYISYSLLLTFLRPLYLSFGPSRSNDIEAILNVLYQNTLILALGASIIWTVHADHRRDWLRSRIEVSDEATGQMKKRSKLAKKGDSNTKAMRASSWAESVGAVGTDEAQWDVVTDGCLEAADTQMLAQARQVHRSVCSVSVFSKHAFLSGSFCQRPSRIA